MSNAYVFRRLRKKYQDETGISISDHDDETIDKWVNDFSAYWDVINKNYLKGRSLEEKRVYAVLRMRAEGKPVPDGVYDLLLLRSLGFVHPKLAKLTNSKVYDEDHIISI